MGVAFERGLMARFAVVAGVSLAVGFGAHWSLSRTVENGRVLERSHTVLEELQGLLLRLRDAESGQRGFLLTGKESYLVPYRRSILSIRRKAGEISRLTGDDPQLGRNLRRVQALVEEKLVEMDETIGLFQGGDTEKALRIVKAERGTELMAEIRGIIRTIVTQEKARLARRDEWAASWTAVMRGFFWTGAGVNVVILVIAYKIVAREMTNRRAAEAALKESESQLRQLNFELEKQRSLLARSNSDLSELAARDGLTGLVNRRYTDEALTAIHARSLREELPLTLIFLDVDHFKRYNDDFGHLAGDEVLKSLATVLRKTVRECDLIGRYGGEEFVVLLPGLDGESGVSAAERIRAAVENSEWPFRKVTASLGVATVDADGQDVAVILAAADRALYASKQCGRNRVTHARNVPADCNSLTLEGSKPELAPTALIMPGAKL